jgi:hypothetical protein
MIRIAQLALCATAAFAQSMTTPPAAALAEMKKLDFMVGQWQGEGWIETGAGNRSTFKGTESVQRKLDGTALLVEGVHRGRMGNSAEEVIVHNALAVISWDDRTQLYRFRASLADGRYTDAEARLTDGALVWGFRQGERLSIRFTIRINEAGDWLEVGEMSPDGSNWRKFFEMTMRRVK